MNEKNRLLLSNQNDYFLLTRTPMVYYGLFIKRLSDWQGWRISLPVLLLFVLVLPAFSGNGQVLNGSHQVASSIDGGVVIGEVSDPHAVVIESGRISVKEGYSVRLLPGTQIKGDQSFHVTVVSKAYYEELAKEAEKNRRDAAMASMLKVCEEYNMDVKGPVLVYTDYASVPKSWFAGQYHMYNAVPVRTVNSVKATFVIYHTQQQTHPLLSPDAGRLTAFVYTPDHSWGSRAETIKVMRS